MHQITVSNIVIDVVRKNIKNLHLSVHPPTGRVRIAVPLRVNDEAVRLFAISKLGWIKKHQARFEGQPRQTPREYVSGESHYLHGERYLLNVIYQKGVPKVVARNKKYIDLYVRPDSNVIQRQRVMTEWYRQQLKAEIPALIEKWQKVMGVKVAEWGIKQMKTRWGTCNVQARRIWLNLELAKKPEHCLEYVVVHELAHLLERHHNDHFITLVSQFMPQWRTYRDELNRFPVSHEEWGY
jgi:predicted metal-dependent hydrolase